MKLNFFLFKNQKTKLLQVLNLKGDNDTFDIELKKKGKNQIKETFNRLFWVYSHPEHHDRG